jgi:uncharacterized membrane protein YkoI
MKKLSVVIVALFAAVAMSASTTHEKPKISMERARAIALQKVPDGTIASAELENEKGKLIYSFDVKTKKPGVTEVNIDAMNGKVVDVHHETPAKEAAEKKAESRSAKH